MFGRGGRNKEDASPDSSPDAAWRTLELTNDWIKHADTKAGITLAATATGAVLLFNQTVAIPDNANRLLYAPSALAAALLLCTAFCCTLALIPRTSAADNVVLSSTLESKNPFFYADIASNWKREPYGELMWTLSSDPEAIVAHLAAQIHVNSDIAATKFRWTNWAVRWLAGAAATLAFVALCVIISNA